MRTVSVAEVPVTARRKPSEAEALRAKRRAERQKFRAMLAGLKPGAGGAVRIDDVPANLRPTWRGRIRAVSRELGMDFVMRARGTTIWIVCRDDLTGG